MAYPLRHHVRNVPMCHPNRVGGGGGAPIWFENGHRLFAHFGLNSVMVFEGIRNCSSVWTIQLNKKETRKNMRIRYGFKETFFVALSNDDLIIGMDCRGQVLKWMWKMNFFGLKKKEKRKKKTGRHTPSKNCQDYFSFRTEKRCFRYPPLVPVMLFIRRSKTVL